MSEETPKEHKKDKAHKLHEQLDKLQAEKDEIFARLQRLSADYLNFQKRSSKQIAESIAYEKESIIKSLLPVLDNFDHTLANTENLQDSTELLKGVKIIYDQFLAILKNHGIEQISTVGQKFDPNFHQALTQKSEPDKENMIILEEFQKGYKLGDKILRPAVVIVNKKASEDQPQVSDAGSENGD
ncbi:MAG: nucleotide exchange factor GrpE [Planctomycetes bacterium HGW-Planctomycetes-1]|nr:MAG: nucleotide exchange factor GrpE [Planctomycetes bacterium HGW-Planctomycetes-1]